MLVFSLLLTDWLTDGPNNYPTTKSPALTDDVGNTFAQKQIYGRGE